ncbi:MAG: phosphopantetheine-binding protein, partial [Paracoccaceae bacterium]|nr:phosphopantetheine-binding protein [Paracoccaceae bacterium]
CEEITRILASLPGIEDAVALADPGPPARILGFVRQGAGAHFDEKGLLSKLEDVLPLAMTPNRILPVAEWPVTNNGKLDRTALIALAERDSRQPALWTPTSATEKAVATLWHDLLGADPRLGRSFLRDGGDSLIALRLVEKVDVVFGVRLALRTVFFEANAADLSAHIQSQTANASELMEEGEI